jgi:hypothetical protein
MREFFRLRPELNRWSNLSLANFGIPITALACSSFVLEATLSWQISQGCPTKFYESHFSL